MAKATFYWCATKQKVKDGKIANHDHPRWTPVVKCPGSGWSAR